ncbi:unnamed protein product, partial [Owenia fusiformis]
RGKNISYSTDTRCGHNNLGYRSVCDPKDKEACCKDNKCQDIPIKECTCPTCFDERSRIYPEFYKWTPHRINMRNNISGVDICNGLRRLNVSSMITIGDSLIRSLTESFWRRVYRGPVTHLLYNHSSKDLIRSCRPNARNWGFRTCWLRSYVQGCNGIKFFYYTVNGIKNVSKEVRPLKEKLRALKKEHPGHMLVMADVGLHTNLNTQMVSHYLEELLDVAKDLGDTHIIYMTPYIPGLHKSPAHEKQTKEKTLNFATFFRTFTKSMNISFLDANELVKNLISWDGTHYSNGLNAAMVDVISSYIIKDL